MDTHYRYLSRCIRIWIPVFKFHPRYKKFTTCKLFLSTFHHSCFKHEKSIYKLPYHFYSFTESGNGPNFFENAGSRSALYQWRSTTLLLTLLQHCYNGFWYTTRIAAEYQLTKESIDTLKLWPNQGLYKRVAFVTSTFFLTCTLHLNRNLAEQLIMRNGGWILPRNVLKSSSICCRNSHFKGGHKKTFYQRGLKYTYYDGEKVKKIKTFLVSSKD